MAAHTRWAEAINDRLWGWRVAMTHHASAEPLPPSLRDPNIHRAYRYLQGARDDQMTMAHALKASPDCKNMRQVLQGFLCARDISPEGIALQLELDADVVRLFEALFFNVRERGDGFRASVLFPETRLGAVVEAEKDFDDLERTLMRVGRDHGWREVARLAGSIPLEDANESHETMRPTWKRPSLRTPGCCAGRPPQSSGFAGNPSFESADVAPETRDRTPPDRRRQDWPWQPWNAGTRAGTLPADCRT